jgi:hypothetical protein
MRRKGRRRIYGSFGTVSDSLDQKYFRFNSEMFLSEIESLQKTFG